MTVINTNTKALFAQNALSVNSRTLTSAMQQLSTGSRINSAKDDAAGLAIGTRMSADLRGMAVSMRNANDGISMMQTAEGALGGVSNMVERMRDLSVQAATGSLTESNRRALQVEVSQLLEELNNVSRTTNFNGIRLLDGSASQVQIQTGIQEGDTVSVRMVDASTDALGIGSRASLTATGHYGATAGSLGKGLASGDLQINGVNIRSTQASDDTLSSGDKASSAVAKVAAINSHSAETGVSATVLTNTAEGSAMTAAAGTGTITINGVTTSSFSTTTDAGTSRADVVRYVNAISDQTGVVAVDTGSATHGVQLEAADGRNITVAFSTLTAASTGLGAAGVYAGGYTLNSESAEPMVISQGVAASADLSKAGLAAGAYQANVSAMTTSARATGATTVAPSTTTTGLLNAGVLQINGVNIRAALSTDDTASDTTATSSTKAASGIAIAAAINASSEETGVIARVEANVVKGTAYTAAVPGGDLVINGVTLTGATASSGLTGSSTRQDVANYINSVTGRTGVVATDNGGGITLTAEDGRNISLAITAGTAADWGVLSGSANVGAAAAAVTTYAKVTLTSDRQFTVQSGSDGNGSFGKLGFKTGTFGGSDSGMKLSDVDISTQVGASRAITALDAALEQISTSRATLGAFQNRLTTAVDNLASQSTTLAESKGRIMDTDYAKATTELARAQIVQQAATAMLAQANQQPAMVLSLLQ